MNTPAHKLNQWVSKQLLQVLQRYTEPFSPIFLLFENITLILALITTILIFHEFTRLPAEKVIEDFITCSRLQKIRKPIFWSKNSGNHLKSFFSKVFQDPLAATLQFWFFSSNLPTVHFFKTIS